MSRMLPPAATGSIIIGGREYKIVNRGPACSNHLTDQPKDLGILRPAACKNHHWRRAKNRRLYCRVCGCPKL